MIYPKMNLYNSYNTYLMFQTITRTNAWTPTTSYHQGDKRTLISQMFSHSASYEQYMKNAATGIANFLKASLKMQESARELLDKETSAFQARTTESSDSKTVTASASDGAAVGSYAVKVESIATEQINSGTSLSKSDATTVSSGVNEFNITIGGKTTKVSAAISASDTNEQALTKLRDAINQAKTGVTASVVTDQETGKIRLELRSDRTGTDYAFEVEDVTGQAMAATGVTQVTRQATNASYRVNGGPLQTSQSNTIELEKGKVTATLAAPSSETVNILVRADSDKILSQVKELVSNYNAMFGRLKEAGGVMNASVRHGLDAVFSLSAYERFGITRHADGTLRLNEEQLKRSLDVNFEQTSRAIIGRYGLAERLSAAAERFHEVPASSLLNNKARQLQHLAMYQRSMQMWMSPSGSGWLMNMLL